MQNNITSHHNKIEGTRLFVHLVSTTTPIKGMFLFIHLFFSFKALRSFTSIMDKFFEATTKCKSEMPDFTMATGADIYSTT